MSEFFQSFLFVFATFLPIMNPFGPAMFFLSMTPGVSTEMRTRITNRMAVYCFIVLMVSIFAGQMILAFFGISLPVLQVGGGLVLLSAGWGALHAPTVDESQASAEKTVKSEKALLSMAFYPLTLPFLTGPGTIAAAAAVGASQSSTLPGVFGCIAASAAMTVITWLCFYYCEKIPKALGAAGADALARLFAFILICLGVGVFWQGLSSLIMSLPK